MSNKKEENIHVDHRKRMRSKFFKSGFTEYHPHEVIEQVLFETLPRINTNPIGHRLIKRFGKINDLLRAPKHEIEKIDGIGPKSAEYIVSFVPKTSAMILEQFRTVSDLTVYQIAFLSDWFMRSAERDHLGLIVCDSNKRFIDYKLLRVQSDLSKLSEHIVEEVAGGCYYIVMKDLVFERSVVYRVLDETAKQGSLMVNAYRLENKRPVSIIFND